MTENQLIKEFIEKNNLFLYKSTYSNGGFSYILNETLLSEDSLLKKQRRDETLIKLTTDEFVNEFVYKVDNVKKNGYLNFENDTVLYNLMKHLLENISVKKLKEANFTYSHHDSYFSDWKFMADRKFYNVTDIQKESLIYIFKNFHTKLDQYTFSDIFIKIEQCCDNNKTFTDVIFSFCKNHMSFFKETSKQNYILEICKEKKINTKILEEEIFQRTNKLELFPNFNNKYEYKQIYIDSNALIEKYSFRLNSSTDKDDYDKIVTTISSYLKKSKVLKELKMEDLFNMKKGDLYIFNISVLPGFNEKLIKNFINESFNYLISINTMKEDGIGKYKTIFEVKHELSEKYPTILNKVLLENKLENKNNKDKNLDQIIKLSNKI